MTRSPARDRAALPDAYEALHKGFGWQVPEDFNIAHVCARRWAQARDGEDVTTPPLDFA